MQPQDQDFFPVIVLIEQVPAVDDVFDDEVGMMRQESFRFFIRIIEKQAHRPRRLVMGVEKFPQDPLQRVQGKRIEEKETSPFRRNLVFHGIGQDESHAPPGRRRLSIGQGFFPQPPVVFHTDGLTARLISQEEAARPLPLP